MAEPSAAVRSFDDEALPHLDALYRVALRLTADPTLAEDLVQDTMLKAYRSWRQYRPGTNAKGWLLTILRNTFINDYRRRKHEPVAMDLEAGRAARARIARSRRPTPRAASSPRSSTPRCWRPSTPCRPSSARSWF